jgi:hypothetical protein
VLEVQTQVCLNLALCHYVAIRDSGAGTAHFPMLVPAETAQFSIMTLRPYVNEHQNQVSVKYTWQRKIHSTY